MPSRHGERTPTYRPCCATLAAPCCAARSAPLPSSLPSSLPSALPVAPPSCAHRPTALRGAGRRRTACCLRCASGACPPPTTSTEPSSLPMGGTSGRVRPSRDHGRPAQRLPHVMAGVQTVCGCFRPGTSSQSPLLPPGCVAAISHPHPSHPPSPCPRLRSSRPCPRRV